MTTTRAAAEGVPSAWRRIGSWLGQWAEALDFNVSEHHEQRIARLEREVAALRGERASSRNAASSRQSPDKEVS